MQRLNEQVELIFLSPILIIIIHVRNVSVKVKVLINKHSHADSVVDQIYIIKLIISNLIGKNIM